MSDREKPKPAPVIRRTFSRVDLDMYGVVDIEQLAAQVDEQIGENKAALAVLLLDMLGEIAEDMELSPAQARQTVNRARFLITRCCPYMNPEKDQLTDELDLVIPDDVGPCAASGLTAAALTALAEAKTTPAVNE